MLTSVRRRLAAASLVLLLPVLSACGLGFGYQTDQVYQPGVGVNDRDGAVNVLGAVVVRWAEGKGTFVASLVNTADQEDELVSVTGEGVQAEIVSPVRAKSDELLNLADTGSVSVTGDRVAEGNFVRLTLEFKSGQKTTVNVPVVGKQDEYSEVKNAVPGSSASTSPESSPSPSATPSP